MEIKASMVKELRDKTGAGMMDAKKALVEAEGNMDKAAEILRQKGIASADKKMGRIAAEGVVATNVEGKVGAMVEINCETDFVAKNEDFHHYRAFISIHSHTAKPLSRNSACFLFRFCLSVLSKIFNSRIHVTVGFPKRLFAVHHTCSGHFS